MMTKTTVVYDKEGPDAVWATLHTKAAIKRSRRNTSAMIPIGSDNEDIERFYEIITDHTIPQEVARDAFPDHYKALSWFTAGYPSSPRWYVEAMLLTDVPLIEITKVAAYDISPLVIDIYKRAFFNVSVEKRQNVGWMRQYIWTPAMEHSTNLYYYDFVLKLAGCYGGPEVLNALVLPSVMSGESKAWLQDVVLDQRDRGVLTSGNVYAKLSPDQQAITQSQTYKDWQAVRDAAASQGVGADSMQLLMEAVKNTVQIINSESSVDSRYEFISEKYTDDQIKGSHHG